MNLKTFLQMYDAPYAVTVINDNSLAPIVRGNVYTVLNEEKNSKIMQYNVVAFGFYDGELTIRIATKLCKIHTWIKQR